MAEVMSLAAIAVMGLFFERADKFFRKADSFRRWADRCEVEDAQAASVRVPAPATVIAFPTPVSVPLTPEWTDRKAPLAA